MKIIRSFLFIVLGTALCSCAVSQEISKSADKTTELELAAKDSLLFDIVFQSCNINRLTEVLTKDFIFLHDQGLYQQTDSQNYADFIKNIINGCAAKQKGNAVMSREIVKGSLRVFVQSNATAVQTGVQRFYRMEEGKEKMVEESKFTRNWRKEKDGWKLASETDYLVNTHPNDRTSNRYIPEPYVPASDELYKTVTKLDSVYFDTYNQGKLAQMDSLTSENIEFYHDRGGLTTSKKDLVESIRKNIFGKVTRILTPGSIEVYEIPGYGAVEFGYHSFRNINEPGQSHPSKFMIIWQLKNGQWQISRVVSLH